MYRFGDVILDIVESIELMNDKEFMASYKKSKEQIKNRDFVDFNDQDTIAKKRLAEIRINPSIGKSEKELDTYLKNRGVNFVDYKK